MGQAPCVEAARDQRERAVAERAAPAAGAISGPVHPLPLEVLVILLYGKLMPDDAFGQSDLC